MPIRTYLINQFNNKKCRLNGIKPSKRMPYKEKLCQHFSDCIQLNNDELPPKVDLRSEMTPVEDQSRVGSCTANSLAGAYEYILKKTNGSNIDVSRLFIYYNGRAKNKNASTITDSGCTMTNAIEALEEYGVCLESVWPYDISAVNNQPDQQAYEQGKDHQITGAFKVNIDLNEMKSCLAQGFPFAFGLRLYKTFNRAANTGVVPQPDAGDQERSEHGRHAMLAVGYSDQSRAFIVRNSWGESWGDAGYCYIPYDYMTNPAYCFDVWTIRELETNDMGHENWDYDDSIDYQEKLQYDGGNNNDDDNEIRQIQEYGDDGDDDDDNTSTSSSSSSD
ncbi:hypothetical protein I4U23_013434 [Adineta vaga]|nr:hypothetical protein I4U23_013434 [Adineta vaga]